MDSTTSSAPSADRDWRTSSPCRDVREYAAINSAIDELIPANYRGRINIIINGTFWIGAAGGALLSIVALNEELFPRDLGWRLTFFLGLVFGLVILLVRRTVPESPRWLFIHGREDEAEKIVRSIEVKVQQETGASLPEVGETITIHQRPAIGFGLIAKTLFGTYPRRAVLGFSLFIGQAFIYNAVTFGFATIWPRSMRCLLAAPGITTR